MKVTLCLLSMLALIGFHTYMNPPEGHASKASVVGFVKVARGETTLLRNGKEKKVKKSMKLLEGDQITTKKKSLLTMYMKDGSIFTIPEMSSLILEKYKISSDKTERNASFKLLFGKIRGAVSSVKSKEPNVVVKTPSAVAGIRGTDIFLEIGKDRKAKQGENTSFTRIACLSGKCMGGSMQTEKKTSYFYNSLKSLLEGTAWASKASVEMVEIPTGTTVSVKKDMSLEKILKTAKKMSPGMEEKIKNNSPTSNNEHENAITANALEIDATDSSNMVSDIETGDDTMVTAFADADAIEELKPAEIKQILGTTRVTIIIDLRNTM